MTGVNIHFTFKAGGILRYPFTGDPHDHLMHAINAIHDQARDYDNYDFHAHCIYCGVLVDIDEVDGWSCSCAGIYHDSRKQQEIDNGF